MSLRVARAVTRIRPRALRFPLQRRGYADPVSDKIKLTLALPHQVGALSPAIDMPYPPETLYFIKLMSYLSDSRYTNLPMCALPFRHSPESEPR